MATEEELAAVSAAVAAKRAELEELERRISAARAQLPESPSTAGWFVSQQDAGRAPDPSWFCGGPASIGTRGWFVAKSGEDPGWFRGRREVAGRGWFIGEHEAAEAADTSWFSGREPGWFVATDEAPHRGWFQGKPQVVQPSAAHAAQERQAGLLERARCDLLEAGRAVAGLRAQLETEHSNGVRLQQQVARLQSKSTGSVEGLESQIRQLAAERESAEEDLWRVKEELRARREELVEVLDARLSEQRAISTPDPRMQAAASPEMRASYRSCSSQGCDVSRETRDAIKAGLERTQMEAAVSQETLDSIKAGLVRTQMEGTVSEEILDAIKAGLVRTQMEGTVSEETQDAIKTGLVRTQMEGTVSEEAQDAIKTGLMRTQTEDADPLDGFQRTTGLGHQLSDAALSPESHRHENDYLKRLGLLTEHLTLLEETRPEDDALLARRHMQEAQAHSRSRLAELRRRQLEEQRKLKAALAAYVESEAERGRPVPLVDQQWDGAALASYAAVEAERGRINNRRDHDWGVFAATMESVGAAFELAGKEENSCSMI